jgi:hypothetical protein
LSTDIHRQVVKKKFLRGTIVFQKTTCASFFR